MGHLTLTSQGLGSLGFQQTGLWGCRPLKNKVEGGGKLAGKACESHPHGQKESGCSEDSQRGRYSSGESDFSGMGS